MQTTAQNPFASIGVVSLFWAKFITRGAAAQSFWQGRRDPVVSLSQSVFSRIYFSSRIVALTAGTLLRKESTQRRHLFWGGSGSNLSRKPAPDEHISECFGEITGRRVVVGTAVAAEPRRRDVDVPGFHPLPANLICILC